MANVNLTDLNVDTLFEQHSIPDIEIVHRRIQTVIESKREELRTMVGESYRDLLKAADTITSMQDSSCKLIQQVIGISENCQKLNEQQLIGFQTSDTSDLLQNRNTNKQLNNYFSTMVQINLLTSLPELIWSHIDDERFYTATELFVFSRHISTGLQLDVHNTLMKQFPIAKKQWEILKPFHVTIKNNVINMLEREELSAEVAVECLLSLLLLEKNNLNGVFKIFLQLRCAAYLNCLSDGSNVDVHNRRVRARILASLKILNNSIELIRTCFMDNGLLSSKLSEHTDANAPPTIALMDSNDLQLSYLVPDIIANFRPKYEVLQLDKSQVQLTFEHWLADISRIANSQLKNLFDFVNTMGTIQEIKNEAKLSRKHIDFSYVAEKFELTQTLDFYELKYVPLINQRVRNIIHDSWLQAMQRAYETLQNALMEEAPIDFNIWADSANDLPLSLEAALNEDRKTKKLLMKTRGYSSVIIQLCTEFDQHLANIVSEMDVLLAEQATRAEEKLALIDFLRETAQTNLMDFITRIKRFNLTQRQRKELLLVLRTCSALIELCPHLKICFCQQSSWRQWVGNIAANNIEYWQRMCGLLDEETFNFWQQLLDGILLDNECSQYLPTRISNDLCITEFANWESFTLEQKDEHENTINSTLHVPNQPSISLQTYLFALIRVLNNVVPQTLPPKVLCVFNHKLLTHILAHYQTFTVATDNHVGQKLALQYYFDLKFLQNVFAVPRDERELCAQFSTLQNFFKDIIDPFDFELFHEQIINNVKRAVSRLKSMLGVLTPHAAHTTTASTLTLTQEKDPNVLILSSSSTTSVWFPLLPIVTNVNNTNMITDNKNLVALENEKQTTPTRKSTTSRKSEPTKAKSSASSFFGAMSQEWFR
ncbi:conserved oligomeric Golgi complex subunit 1-like isoform X2 [Teleopsis dalmanni]|uniref:conserved oligomeric Golgi complex subunit 1-like isoform X2 n=1 Tax=Teleopsis dalmanni TaxID=139649 RepID=UPI0018CDB7A4|nr:conserved oligomeric Golgi complex subunit 1-like isoform X2 [Teleopsis dalmanni]